MNNLILTFRLHNSHKREKCEGGGENEEEDKRRKRGREEEVGEKLKEELEAKESV